MKRDCVASNVKRLKFLPLQQDLSARSSAGLTRSPQVELEQGISEFFATIYTKIASRTLNTNKVFKDLILVRLLCHEVILIVSNNCR